MKTTKKIYKIWFNNFGSLCEFESSGKALKFMSQIKRNSKEEPTLFIDEEDLNYKPFNKL